MLAIAFDSSALQEVVMSRIKTGCLPGCNNVVRTKTLSYVWDVEIGDNVYFWVIDISCSGTGISSCPSSIVAPLNPGDNDGVSGFEISSIDLMLVHAYNEISNSNNNGSYNTNYLNTTTGDLWTYYIVWQYQLNTDSSTTESYVVSREKN